MNPDLAELLQYKNNQVIEHFCHHHPEYSLQEGYELFKDLLAWYPRPESPLPNRHQRTGGISGDLINAQTQLIGVWILIQKSAYRLGRDPTMYLNEKS